MVCPLGHQTPLSPSRVDASGHVFGPLNCAAVCGAFQGDDPKRTGGRGDDNIWLKGWRP